jgi:hypothetical protein
MVAKRFGLAVLVVVTILAMAPMASAQNAGIFCPPAGGSCGVGCDPCGQGFWMGLGVRKYINSFTSFELPSNVGLAVPVGKARYEWPLDQLYGAIKLGYCRGPVGIAVDYMSTFGSSSGKKAQETYWDAEDSTVTLFGTGTAKHRGSVFDVAATWALPIAASKCEEPACGVAAVVGFRQQSFRYNMKDLNDNDESTTPRRRYPGEVEDFGQYYTHWYIGGILTKCFDIGSLMGGCCPPSHKFLFAFQGDYAFVRANNNLADFVHYVYVTPGEPNQWDNWQRTKGGCWHLNASVAMDAGQCVKIILEGDFRRLTTWGQQDLHANFAPGTEWNGGKTWSDQAYVGLMAAYGF